MPEAGNPGKTGYVQVEGARLYYHIDGPEGAPVVVFSNSLGTDLGMWELQVERFTEQLQVVRYDSRGHGRSDAPAGPYSIDLLGRDLLTLLDALDILRAHVCGLSLGGMAAQWLAIHHPDRVGRAVFADTAARIGSEAMWDERIQLVRAGGMRAIRERIVARFLSERFRQRHPDVTQRIGDTLEAMSPAGYIAACQALRDADLRGQESRIHAPSLVVVGALDEATPPSQAQELHAAIAGSALLILPDAAHLANVEQPDAFNARVLEFLTSA
jgi:3-oxoadipate enol-lactonase